MKIDNPICSHSPFDYPEHLLIGLIIFLLISFLVG